jgi:hypothetical protein
MASMVRNEASGMVTLTMLGEIFPHMDFILIRQMLIRHKSEEFAQRVL